MKIIVSGVAYLPLAQPIRFRILGEGQNRIDCSILGVDFRSRIGAKLLFLIQWIPTNTVFYVVVIESRTTRRPNGTYIGLLILFHCEQDELPFGSRSGIQILKSNHNWRDERDSNPQSST